MRFQKFLFYFLLLSLALSFYKNIGRVQEIKRMTKEKEEKVKALEEEEKDLEKKLEEVKSDDYIEKQIRDKLGLAKEGEIVVILPPPEVLRKFAPEDREEEEVLPDPNWKKWARLFGF